MIQSLRFKQWIVLVNKFRKLQVEFFHCHGHRIPGIKLAVNFNEFVYACPEGIMEKLPKVNGLAYTKISALRSFQNFIHLSVLQQYPAPRQQQLHPWRSFLLVHQLRKVLHVPHKITEMGKRIPGKGKIG